MCFEASIEDAGEGAEPLVVDAVTIAASQPVEVLLARLGEGLKPLIGKQGLRVELHGRRAEKPGIVECRCHTTDAEQIRWWRRRLADVLADLILADLQLALLDRVIRTLYGALDEEQRLHIRRQAQAALESGWISPGQQARRRYILDRLREHLEQHDELHLDGFVKFRLPEYLSALEDAVDRAVDELLMQREYRDFIRFLRYFVEARDPRLPTVHAVVAPGGDFRLFDGTGDELVTDELRQLVRDDNATACDWDDLLISALVSLCPSQIWLHDPHAACHPETRATLDDVFARRLHVCRGCPLCDQRHRAE